MPLKMTLADLAGDARRNGVTEVDVDELIEAQSRGVDALIIDVREPDERARGYIPGSIHIPRGVLERDIEKKAFNGKVAEAELDRPMVCYCGGGHRSLLAVEALIRMGFTRATSLEGGFHAWGQSGQPVGHDRGGP